MRVEIEARLLDCDPKKFISILESMNAKFIDDYLQLRYCYDFNPKKENSWIRLRTNGKETTLTIKEISSNKVDGTKESEIIVSDFDTTNEILEKLGYIARSKQENRRIRYILDGVEIDIDLWPQIPALVEFEASSEAKLKQVIDKLGIDYAKLTTLDIQSIYLHYGISKESMDTLILEDSRKTKFLNKEKHYE